MTMERIGIQHLDRPEETLSAAEAGAVTGGAPYVYFGANYPIYPAYPGYAGYPVVTPPYPVIGTYPAYPNMLYNYSPFYPGYRVVSPPVIASPFYRYW